MDEKIRVIVSKEYSREKGRARYYMELAGPHDVITNAATKPGVADGLITGSLFQESDNAGKVWIFDETADDWDPVGGGE